MAVLVLAIYVSFVRGPGVPFERQAWLEAGSLEGEIKCLRGRMLRDLRDRVLRPGLTRQAVIELLGPADAARPGELAYGLGFCAGPGKTASLILHFDGDDALVHTSLVGL